EQRMKEQVVVFEAPPSPEPTKESLQILVIPPPWKPPDAESRVVTPSPLPNSGHPLAAISRRGPPPKPPDL
ncbi:hypothetical protein A2U01_0111617, partial [Trifolium medium]|nr:hypothetical protein [Trifolium medium]